MIDLRAVKRVVLEPVPLGIVDVHYEGAGARAACAVARGWGDADACEERVADVAEVLAYKPGAFFERELPCIVRVLSLLRASLGAVVIDGYVDLDASGAPGLGAHLYEHLGRSIPVVGVAKTAFRGSDFAVKVLRGASQSPLFVTARGMPVEDAALLVTRMHGPNRIPTLLGRADQLARGTAVPRIA
jgi:deoxyribonuclease V